MTDTFKTGTAQHDELPMPQHHLLEEEAISLRQGRFQHCFRSAYRHIRFAWKLHHFDNEMSLFRAITGEEEAASALILSLKQQQYSGAEKLKPSDHRHKAADTPFLDAVNNALVLTSLPTPKLGLSIEKQSKLSLSIDVTPLGSTDEPLWATPDHPFNFTMTMCGDKKAYLFERELEEIASASGSENITRAIKERANLRNRLLYASDQGIPHIEFPAKTLLRYRERIYRLCILTIGILQTRQHQLFVEQNLSAFLSALDISMDTQTLSATSGHERSKNR